MKEQLKLIRTNQELEALNEYLIDKNYVALDTETTGIEKSSEIIGVAFCAESNVAYYVILAYWSKEEQKLIYLETKESIKKTLELCKTKKLICHNAIFDCWQVSNNYGVELIDAVHTDTMILAHLLDENRPVGLKDLGVAIYGQSAKKEQEEMKASVEANGGVLTKNKFELYKGDADLIGYYGAKDTILTLNLFYHFIPELFAQGLDDFFYKEESMPLLKGPTYQLNTTGLRVDPEKLQKLKNTLETECLEDKAYIYKEITPIVKEEYPDTNKKNKFNIGSSKQLAWLLFIKLGNDFNTLTDEGKSVCKALGMSIPYSPSARKDFVETIRLNKDRVYCQEGFNFKTKKVSRAKKVQDPWNYLQCSKDILGKLAKKYKWVERLLSYSKKEKLLNTYVEGIQSRMQYNIIRPNFMQHGTTSGRYSCKNPNFQNLPRDDKRIKSCIIPRPGKVFVGADYSQLEPRVFASFSGDKRLLDCFKNQDDFYSVIGKEVFNKEGSLKKTDKDSFAVLYPKYRDIAKVVGLSATYGTTAAKMAGAIGKSIQEAQEVIDDYFDKFPSVKEFMLSCHHKAKTEGRVSSLFGRIRRMPEALEIEEVYGDATHAELPYDKRNLLNLAVNHTVQSTGASIMNRAMIMFFKVIRDLDIKDCKIVSSVHDEIIVECLEEDSETVRDLLRHSMTTCAILPGVELEAEPKIANNLADLK